MRTQTLAIGQGGHYRPDNLKPLGRDLLCGDVLQEGLCVDTTVLAREAVRREGVICPRRVVTTAID
jgi:hypothetical protein